MRRICIYSLSVHLSRAGPHAMSCIAVQVIPPLATRFFPSTVRISDYIIILYCKHHLGEYLVAYGLIVCYCNEPPFAKYMPYSYAFMGKTHQKPSFTQNIHGKSGYMRRPACRSHGSARHCRREYIYSCSVLILACPVILFIVGMGASECSLRLSVYSETHEHTYRVFISPPSVRSLSPALSVAQRIV